MLLSGSRLKKALSHQLQTQFMSESSLSLIFLGLSGTASGSDSWMLGDLGQDSLLTVDTLSLLSSKQTELRDSHLSSEGSKEVREEDLEMLANKFLRRLSFSAIQNITSVQHICTEYIIGILTLSGWIIKERI